MTPSNYDPQREAAIGWLMGRINYERASVIPYDEQSLKLDRARELLKRLGAPEERLRIVHIAGTKGKGSTGAMIAAAFEAAGLRTGVSSSPHLERVEERFAVGGQPCSGAELVELVDLVRPIALAMDQEPIGGPTFFDLTTAMALAHFERRAVDAVVLEVGLGGRLDSTNVVTPQISLVTSISLDHTRQLGASRDLIAAEKAGIFKAGVAAVSGVADTEAGDVIEQVANDLGCPFWRAERDFRLEEGVFTRSRADGSTERFEGVAPALPGRAQSQNAATALATLGVLHDKGWNAPIEARRQGVATARLPARMERFAGRPLIVIDGAHNDASAAALAETLDELCGATPRERRVLVIAMSNDKSPAAILEPLARRFAAIIATRYLDNPRAVEPDDLAAVAGRFAPATAVHTAPTPDQALRAAKRLAGEAGAIVLAGSLLFAAEGRRLVLAERGAPPGGPAF